MRKQQWGGRNSLGVIATLALLQVLLTGATSALETKNLTRDFEPVVKTAADLRLNSFYGSAIVNLAAYRYIAATSTWEQVPVQVDNRYYRNFGQEVQCVENFPPCACATPNTCNLCEYSYAFDGQSDPDDAPNSNALDANDEVSFMAKDTGDEAPESSGPSGTTGLPRYAIRVSGPPTAFGWLYLYKYTSAAPTVPPYMEIGVTGSGATQQTTMKACSHPLLAGFDVYETVLKGNWSLTGLKVQAAGTSAACGVSYSGLDVLDRVKWRMGGETDELWNTSSTYLGSRAGTVRVIRGSIGAQSGFGTTHYYTAYPTLFREDVHLRVHNLGPAIIGYIDWNSAAANLNGQSCPVQNFEVRRMNVTLPFDHVDGCFAAPFTAGSEDSRQLNGPYISLVDLFLEDVQHPVPAQAKLMYYSEDRMATLETGLEDEQGAYGNIGIKLTSVNPTEERNCTETNFAGMSRIWQVKVSDTGSTRSTTLLANLKSSPLEATSMYQCYGCGGGGGPSTPCTPTLTANNPGNGFQSKLAVASPCGGNLWFRLSRGVGTSGPLTPLASIGASAAFDDYAVVRGETYRYVAESYNAVGTVSSPTAAVSVTITDAVPPVAPTISGSVSGAAINVAWSPTIDFDLAGYNVYRAAQSGGPYTKLTLAGAIRATDYSFQVVQTGTTHYVVVKAVDAAGQESAASNELTLVVP